MNLRKLTDDELAAQFESGTPSTEVLVEAYRRFLPRLMVRASRFLGDAAAYAEDVAQETLSKILMRGDLTRLKDRKGFNQYLLKSAERAAIDIRRKIGREVPEGQIDLEGMLNPNALDDASRLELKSVVERLEQADRELLEMFSSGLVLSDIAKIKGISYSAAAQRLSRTITKARAIAAESHRRT